MLQWIIKIIKKKNIYIYLFFFLTAINFSYATLWIWEVKGGLKWTDSTDIGWIIQWAIVFFLWFLALITVIMIIWSGFTILTAADDEEKVKTAKKRIIYSLVWITVIFLSYQIAIFATKGLGWS